MEEGQDRENQQIPLTSAVLLMEELLKLNQHTAEEAGSGSQPG
jgi:hypothetical protein